MNMSSALNGLGNEKRLRSISYTLVFLMLTCVVLTLSILIRDFLPAWHADIMEVILLFIVIDRLYTYRHLRSLVFWSQEWIIAIGAQWVVILVVSRLLISYANGPDTLRRDLSLFSRGYLLELVSPEFIVTVFFAFTVWVLSSQFLQLLDEIGLDMNAALREESLPLRANTIPAHQRMVGLILSTGIGIVILTALTRINLSPLAASASGFSSSRFSGAETGALLYFVFGLALLSLSRLMSLQTQWNRLRIPVSSAHLPRQWAMYSFFFLLLLGTIASALPAGDSLGFFSVLGTLFGYLISIFVFIAQLVMALMLLFVSLMFVLFGKAPPFIRTATPPPLPVPPSQPLLPSNGNATWELIRSIFLWGTLVVVLVYSIARFISQHDDILASLRKSRLVNWLVLAWQWLYKSADKAGSALRSVIAEGWHNLRARLGAKQILPRPGWLSVRSLDPRQRVYFFYLAMIRRGNEQGVTRSVSQTPRQYASKLENALPDASQDVDSITDAFIQARYSRREIDLNTANGVKTNWDRIRQALRDKAKRDKSTR